MNAVLLISRETETLAQQVGQRYPGLPALAPMPFSVSRGEIEPRLASPPPLQAACCPAPPQRRMLPKKSRRV